MTLDSSISIGICLQVNQYELLIILYLFYFIFEHGTSNIVCTKDINQNMFVQLYKIECSFQNLWNVFDRKVLCILCGI